MGNQNGDSIQVLPFAGAAIHELTLDGVTVVNGSPDLEEFTQNAKSFPGAQLCPFAGRIANGKYRYGGRKYSLPYNDPAGENAIHGLVHDKQFYMTDSRIHTDSAWISFSYTFPGQKGYPFHFQLENKFLLERNSLTIETTVRNLDDEHIPMGHGWHAYFTLNKDIKNLSLKLPTSKMYELDKFMIPSGKWQKLSESTTPLGDLHLDDCFVLPDGEGVVKTLLYDDTHEIEVWQEQGLEGYNYLVIYTPSDRKSVAIEPMTNAPDSFNNGHGLLELAPETEFKFRTGVVLRKVK